MKSTRKLTKFFVASLVPIVLVLMLSIWPAAVQAATVNIPDGDVAGLIAAINAANTNPGADTINLAPGGTYTLTTVDNTVYGPSGLPVVTSPITINGNGATIERSSAIGTPAFRIVYVGYIPTSGDLTLHSVTLRGGNTSYYGGAIMNHGTLTVTESKITGNYSFDGGGGIYTSVTAAITSTVISDNSSTYYASGIFNEVGTLTLTDSAVSDNSSTRAYRNGGIVNILGSVTLIDTTVSGNKAGVEGAGGIFNWFAGARLTLINSTVSGNTGRGYAGGILNSGGVMTISNSTVFGNQDINNGPGGISNYNNASRLKNTVVANNSPSDCGSAIVSLGHNIVSDASCGFTGPGDLNSLDPLLGILADHGGLTPTHMPRVGSPAIDAVPLADCTDASGNPIATDQRGVARPQGTACDIGAVEGNLPPVANAGPDQTVEATSSAGAIVTLNGTGSSGPDGDPLTYNWTGLFGTVSGVGPTVTLPIGSHTLTLTVSNGQATATDTINIIVQDTTAPGTSLDSAVDGNVLSLASGGSTPSGSITFTFGGTDAVGVTGFQCKLDGAAYTSCTSPMDYSALALGSHTFQVWALDAAGNVDPSAASFTWTVVAPAQAIQNLLTTVGDMGLPSGVANSLSAPLGQAFTLLNDNNPNNDIAACGKLDAFINQVNAQVQNGQLTSAQASQLLQEINAIKASLSC